MEEAAKSDLYEERLDEAIDALRALVKDDKMSNMETYRSDIIEALNVDIVMRYAYRSGVQEHMAVTDEEVARAIELLLDEEEYRRILSEQHLEKR